MIQVWKTGDFVGNDIEDQILKDNSKVLKKVDSVVSAIERRVNKDDIFKNNVMSTFNQHCRIKLPPYFLDSLAYLNKKTKEGNDFGLRYIIIEVKDQQVSLIGGTSSKIYRLKMNNLDTFEEVWKTNPFDFCVALSCDEIDALLEYTTQMCNVSAIEIGSREEFPDKMFMLAYSTVISNSADEENSSDKFGMVLFRLEDSKEGYAIVKGIPEWQTIETSEVVYKSIIYPHIKNRFKTDKEYVELAQKRGVMVIKSENKDAGSTAVMFTGCAIESSNGNLPADNETFAAVNGEALMEVLEYKQPVEGGIRKYDPYTFIVWFNECEDALMSSDVIMLQNIFMDAFISQKSVRMALPEKEEFVVTKKGKIEAVEEKEALDNSLKNADMKNKQERAKFVDEVMKDSVEKVAEENNLTEDLTTRLTEVLCPEPSSENIKSGLEDEFAEVKKSVGDIQLKLSQQQPIEVDYETEKEFRERTDNLQKSMNEIMEGVDALNKRIDKFDNMMEIMKSMLFDRMKEVMANKKNEPVNKEELDKALNDTIDKPLTTEQVCLKDTGEELTGTPVREAVETYLKECIGDVVNKKVLFNVMTEYKADSVYRKLLEMGKGNVIYQCKSDPNIFYIPKDFLFRLKNFKNKVQNKAIAFNEKSLLPEKNEEEGKNEN